MKKFTRFVTMILILSFALAIPTYAESVVDPRGSAFFGSYGTDLEKTDTRKFRIWFDVDANAAVMDEIGVSEIVVYRSADQSSWTEMKTFWPEDYPQMLDYNTSSHTNYVTYNTAYPGYYYRARVTFYAKNSTGIGERDVYTEILQM